MNKVLCLLLVTAAFACSKKEGDSSSGGGECGDAVNKGIDAVNESRKGQLANAEKEADSPEKKERLEKGAERASKMTETLRPILIKHCTDDKWSAQAITCMSKVTRREDIQACVQGLPKDQQDRVTQDVMAAMANGMRMRPPGQPSLSPHGGMTPFQHPPMGSAVPTGSGAPTGSATPPPPPAGSAATPPPAGSAAPKAVPAGSAAPTK
jgi:hypothetical protein